MLSLSKRQYGFFPRYTRALAAGEVALAVHSPRPFQWTGNVVPSSGTVVRHRDVCAALNAEVNSSRLVLQMRTGAAHHVPTSRRDCYAAAELGAVWNGSRAMRRVCDLLPAGQSAAPSQQRLVEPMEQFFLRMREARSTSVGFRSDPGQPSRHPGRFAAQVLLGCWSGTSCQPSFCASASANSSRVDHE